MNRVPTEKLAQGLEPVCGRCKTPLAVDGKPVTVTDATFAADVEHSPLPGLLDMGGTGCGPGSSTWTRTRPRRLDSAYAAFRRSSCCGMVGNSIASWVCSPSRRSRAA